MNTTTATSVPYAEPWLRGTHTDVPPVGRAVLHALELAVDDAHRWTEGLSDLEIHSRAFGLMPVAAQIKHIAGSVDRLLTYAEGNQLSSEQITAMKTELDLGISREELLAEFHEGLERSAARVRAFASADLEEPRGVGKKQLPTSVGGLLVHLADHTQRHTGQIVTTAKVLKAENIPSGSVAVHGLS